MFNLFHFSFYYLLLSSWFKDASAFVCASSGQEARRGKVCDANRERAHPRVTQTINAAASSSSLASAIDDTASAPSESNKYFDVLQDAIYLNSTEASSVILSKITEIRQSGEYTKEEQENFLNGLLALGPDAQLPIWTIVRPLTRFSRRARMRSLRRTLDMVTPDFDRKNDSVESQLQRRRRALVSLLNSLSSEAVDNSSENEKKEVMVEKKSRRRPAIVALEIRAIKASKDSGSDLTSRRPENLETPEYDVIASGKDASNRMAKNIEIRSYKPYSVCTVSMVKPRPSTSAKTDQKLGAPELGGASSFGALAGYLFGKNDQSTAMKMTMPVFTTNPGEVSSEIDKQDDRKMEFVLPSNYWGTENLSKAPMPLESSGVTLQERESETRAVLMFGGYASKKEAEERKKELLSTLSKRDSKWRPIEDTLSLAQYNDPFTVPWRRLNEVSVKVENR
jgi:hypothetical protein